MTFLFFFGKYLENDRNYSSIKTGIIFCKADFFPEFIIAPCQQIDHYTALYFGQINPLKQGTDTGGSRQGR